ncbi:nuclear movement protein NudC like protein [Babesia gibsoni]|uniref:Nuclear migration protein nudC n=1 Tax=Babesia gibsoni TaxID=33632 RepID=A0AAD8PGK6_BABGI|nr:nuclear movement protein NudC like protein [Babesia gibsoni]
MTNFNEIMHVAIRGFTNIEQLLEAFFGFLCTQTDFYHTQLSDQDLSRFGLDKSVNLKGFKPDHMRMLLMNIYEKNLQAYRERHQPYLLAQPVTPKDISSIKGTGSSRMPVSKDNKITTKKVVANATEDEANAVKSDGAIKTDEGKAYRISNASNVEELLSTDYTITTWNGARTKRYCWSQTFTDVTVELVSREPLASKDVKVNISKTSLELIIKGHVVLNGTFPHVVNSSESTWSIEDKRRIMLSLDKPSEIWWDCLIVGDEKIDVTQIESVKRLDEFTEPEQSEMIKLMRQHRVKQQHNQLQL